MGIAPSGRHRPLPSHTPSDATRGPVEGRDLFLRHLSLIDQLRRYLSCVLRQEHDHGKREEGDDELAEVGRRAEADVAAAKEDLAGLEDAFETPRCASGKSASLVKPWTIHIARRRRWSARA